MNCKDFISASKSDANYGNSFVLLFFGCIFPVGVNIWFFFFAAEQAANESIQVIWVILSTQLCFYFINLADWVSSLVEQGSSHSLIRRMPKDPLIVFLMFMSVPIFFINFCFLGSWAFRSL